MDGGRDGTMQGRTRVKYLKRAETDEEVGEHLGCDRGTKDLDRNNDNGVELLSSGPVFAFCGPPSYYFSICLLLIPQAPVQPVCVFLPPLLLSPSLSHLPPNHHYTSFSHLISIHHLVAPLENANQFAGVLLQKGQRKCDSGG